MKLRSLVFLALVPLLSATTQPACDQRGAVELSIFHTNDLHSRLRASKNDPFGLGGLARLKTLLDEKRAKTPNSLSIDAGDWSEGSWYFVVDSGGNMLRFLNAMGFDAACVGNHDFLAGPDELIKAVHSAPPMMSVLAANFDTKNYPHAQELKEAVPPYTIREVAGLKIGIIGISIEAGVYDSYLAPVKLKDPVLAATEAALELRDQVDVLIISSHNDIDLNRRMAREVPGVDVVISGHTHIKTPRAFMEDNQGRKVPVVETGYWGKFLGELKLVIYPKNTLLPGGRVQVKGHELYPVSPDIPEDPAIARMVDEQDRILDNRYGRDVNEVVAYAEEDLDQIDYTESTLANLSAKSYRELTGADLGMENSTLIGIGLAAGPVTVMDLHDVIPHTYNPVTGKEWTVQVWNAKGEDLNWLITALFLVNGIVPSSSPLGWLVVDGADIIWTPIFGKDALNVRQILVNGKPLEKDRRYTVALSDGMLRGLIVASSLLPHHFDLSDLKDTGVQAWESVLKYGSEPGHLKIEHLRTGLHTKVSGQDLRVLPYEIKRDSKGLSIHVENMGSKKSDDARLRCFSGLPDDLVAYDTDLQKWTKIGETRIPRLETDAAADLHIDWDFAPLATYWPIKCAIDKSDDRYHPNDSAVRVFKTR